jgi:hypothetical protein
MSLENTKPADVTYATVLADGMIHVSVPESTQGAVLREYETSTGEKGSKWEHVFTKLSGMISGIQFYEGDYGNQLQITIADEGEKPVVLSLSMSQNFAEDLAKKIPAMDVTKRVVLSPYVVEDEKTGKIRKGISVVQDEKKIQNFFYDFHDKKVINGFPEPKFKLDKKTGENKPFSKEEWKIFFAECRVFLTEYITEHHLIVPKNDLDTAVEARAVTSKYYDKDDVDVRFDAIGQPDDVPSVDVGDEKPF